MTVPTELTPGNDLGKPVQLPNAEIPGELNGRQVVRIRDNRKTPLILVITFSFLALSCIFAGVIVGVVAHNKTGGILLALAGGGVFGGIAMAAVPAAFEPQITKCNVW